MILWWFRSNIARINLLSHGLTHSSLIGLDAEWKPNRQASTYPTVSLLQIACRCGDSSEFDSDESPVFLLDLQSIHLPEVYELLRDVFVSPDVVKLGFRFKQDLVYLSSTFCEKGCEPGFDRVEPYIDITTIYNYLQPKQLGRRVSKQNKSLATICKEILCILLSKEFQCSDWSQRPLTKEQKTYAAEDAHCLVQIFNVFQHKVVREASFFRNSSQHWPSDFDPGLKKIFKASNDHNLVTRTKFCEASTLIRTSMPELCSSTEETEDIDSVKSHKSSKELDDTLLWIIKKHGDKILLKDSDRKPQNSKKRTKKCSLGQESKPKFLEVAESWQGPAPWDPSVGGDGCPKFLCDAMIEGLAKHLRCVGVDCAIPYSKKPDTRDLIDQAQKEKRVLLTRDAKILRHEYLIKNQMYRVKSLLKNEQLLEVIETFELKISEDQLMSRCTKCNGRFIQKPLTTEEAVEASKGFQVIPNCLFNKSIEFWQCMDCNQLYWELKITGHLLSYTAIKAIFRPRISLRKIRIKLTLSLVCFLLQGTQYHNAMQKFIDVCKLNE